MDVIDVTVQGGPDIATVVRHESSPAGTVVRIAVANDSDVPARPARVGVLVETPPVRAVTAPGWELAEPGWDGGRGSAVTGAPWLATDRGVVGWLGSARHRGDVAIKADGWLLTAWAHLPGVILWPGERIELDALWVGGDDPAAYATAWAARAPAPLRPLPTTEVTLVEAGGAPPARGLAVATGVAQVARLADATGGPVGVAVDPWPADGDLTRAGVPTALAAAGAGLAATGACWVTVLGAGRTLADGPRWGEAATTPIAALHDGLVELRRGLGPGPVLHLAGGPPAVGAGGADVVDTGPGWPSPDPLGPPSSRAGLDGTVWHAATGPLAPGPPDALLGALDAVTACRVHVTG